MNKKNGFTLVELMVVIVIIGVLAAVAVPKMMAATNKAKASEGPQMLGAISNLEHAFGAEYGAFAEAAADDSVPWIAIGMSGIPTSNFFEFYVDGSAFSGTGSSPKIFPDDVTALSDFTVTAELTSALGDVAAKETITVDHKDEKKVSTKKLQMLIGSYGATAPTN